MSSKPAEIVSCKKGLEKKNLSNIPDMERLSKVADLIILGYLAEGLLKKMANFEGEFQRTRIVTNASLK